MGYIFNVFSHLLVAEAVEEDKNEHENSEAHPQPNGAAQTQLPASPHLAHGAPRVMVQGDHEAST